MSQSPLTDFALTFIDQAVTTFPALQPRLQLAKFALPDEAQILEYCVQHVMPHCGYILFANLQLFDDLEVGTCFLPGIDFRWFFEATTDAAVHEAVWKSIRDLFCLVSSIANPHDSKYTHLHNDFLQAMDPDEVRTRIEEMFASFDNDRADESEMRDGPQTTRSERSERCFAWAQRLSGMKMGRLVNDLVDMIRERFPDMFAELEQMQRDLEQRHGSNPSGKLAMSVFYEYMKNNAARWRDVMAVMRDVIKSKIDKGEINQQELVDESMAMMKEMAGMSKEEQRAFFKKTFEGMLPKGAQLNVSAMKQKLALQETRERLRAKAARAAVAATNLPKADAANAVFYANLSTLSHADQQSELDRLVQSIESAGKPAGRRKHR